MAIDGVEPNSTRAAAGERDSSLACVVAASQEDATSTDHRPVPGMEHRLGPDGVAYGLRDVLIVAAIFLIALIVRWIYVFQMRASPLFDHLQLDSLVHDRWARAILAGQPFFEGAYFKAPLYPYFLALIYKLFGGGYLAPRLVQAVMGSASCGLVYLLGREAFGRVTGTLAGVAAATFWVMVYFDGELLLEPLSIFLNLLSIWLMLRAARGEGIVGWLASGLVLGLSAITRPNVLVFVPVAVLWVAFTYRRRWRVAVSRAVFFALACLLPIAPVTIRNYVVGDDFVLIASQAGPNLYIGNNPGSNGRTAFMPGARASWQGGYMDWISLAEQETGRKLKPSEVSGFFVNKAWAFMRTHRLAAVNLMFIKFQLFFYEWEIPNNHDLYFMTDRFAAIVRYLPLPSGAVLSIGLVGLLLSLNRAGRRFPLWSLTLVYSATVIAFFVCSRFRLPVMPLFILFAAFVPVRLWSFFKAERWSPLIGSVLLIYIAWIAINRGIPETVMKIEAARTQCGLALALAAKGDMQGSARECRAALQLSPESAQAEMQLGLISHQAGDFEEAIRHFRRALKLKPRADIHKEYAHALVVRGRWAEAIGVLRKGLQVYEGYADLKVQLAFLLSTCPVAAQRDGPAAVQLAEEAARVGLPTARTFDALACAYAEAGRFEEAISAARRGLELARASGNALAVDQIQLHLLEFGRGRPIRQNLPAE